MTLKGPRRASDRDTRGGAYPGEAEHRPGNFGDAVTHGVQLGYQVVEEQIRQGQRAAEEISRASYGPSAMGDDLREATERMWRYYMDLGRLWFDFVSSFNPAASAWSRDGRGWTGRDTPPAAGSAPPTRYPHEPRAQRTESAAAASQAVSVQVQSRRPVRVALDLRPGARGEDLHVSELRASQGTRGLADVVLEAGPPGFPPTVCVRVPDEQPPDTYLGVVVDRRTGERVGSLSVSVSR